MFTQEKITSTLLDKCLSRECATDDEFVAVCMDLRELLRSEQGHKTLGSKRMDKWMRENREQLVRTLNQRAELARRE